MHLEGFRQVDLGLELCHNIYLCIYNELVPVLLNIISCSCGGSLCVIKLAILPTFDTEIGEQKTNSNSNAIWLNHWLDWGPALIHTGLNRN